LKFDALDQFIQDIARGAGRIQMDRRNAFGRARSKSGKGDFVTEVDEACERYLIDAIRIERPNASILSEESGASGSQDAEEVWIMDPLDGTRNYVEGIPFFCVSVGMVRSGRVEAGAIYDPVHDEMFYARRGGGGVSERSRNTSFQREVAGRRPGLGRVGEAQSRAQRVREVCG